MKNAAEIKCINGIFSIFLTKRGRKLIPQLERAIQEAMAELDRATALKTTTGTMIPQSTTARSANRMGKSATTTTGPTAMRWKKGFNEHMLIKNAADAVDFDKNVTGLASSSGNKRTGKGRATRATTRQQCTKPIRIAPKTEINHQKCLRNTNNHVLPNNLSK